MTEIALAIPSKLIFSAPDEKDTRNTTITRKNTQHARSRQGSKPSCRLVETAILPEYWKPASMLNITKSMPNMCASISKRLSKTCDDIHDEQGTTGQEHEP